MKHTTKKKLGKIGPSVTMLRSDDQTGLAAYFARARAVAVANDRIPRNGPAINRLGLKPTEKQKLAMASHFNKTWLVDLCRLRQSLLRLKATSFHHSRWGH